MQAFVLIINFLMIYHFVIVYPVDYKINKSGEPKNPSAKEKNKGAKYPNLEDAIYLWIVSLGEENKQ